MQAATKTVLGKQQRTARFIEFSERHSVLMESEKELAADDYLTKDQYMITEDDYSTAKAKILDRLKSFKTPVPTGATGPPAQPSSVEHGSVPKTVVPTFNGKQSEWETFKELFCSVIKDKPNLSAVLKLQHLMNNVEGEAKSRLKGMKMIGSNLEVAWDKLLRRYDNPKRRLATHLDTLIHLKPASRKNVDEMNRLLDSADEAIQGLKDLDCPVEQWDNFIVHCLVCKLDADTRETWEISQENEAGFPTYTNFNKFLEKRVQSLEQAHAGESFEKSKANPSSQEKRQKSVSAFATQSSRNSSAKASSQKISKFNCPICSGSHMANMCDTLIKLSPLQRIDFCKKENRCTNCLKKGHFASDCPSSNRCYVCQEKHHTKLHIDKAGGSEFSSAHAATVIAAESESSVSAFTIRSKGTRLLPTVQVVLMNAQGKKIPVRGLVDQGAVTSFVSEHVVEALSLPRRPRNIRVTGVGASTTAIAKSEVSLTLLSNVDSEFKFEYSALVLGKLTQLLPAEEVVEWSWDHLAGLTLADPNLHLPAKVDCILGADVYPAIIREGLRKGPTNAMVAEATALGWIVTGQLGGGEKDSVVQSFHTHVEPSLSEILVKYWELEEIHSPSVRSPDEQQCEDHFKETHFRDATGRFVVRYPFSKTPLFSDSRHVAVACLLRSEKRRARDPLLDQAYCEFMEEYYTMGHMELVEEDGAPECCYLPQHPIVKFKPAPGPGAEEPLKICRRVVFNGSQNYGEGESLNDCLLPGPKLQTDISAIMTRWRLFGYVFTTDIKKMFRQILLHPDDRNWQRIVWRKDRSQPIQDFRLRTVTYGTKPAPFLAIRVLQQLAEDGEGKYPEAAKALRQQCYVDDILAGADDLAAACRLRKPLIDLLASAGMQLGKWSANHEDLLKGLSEASGVEHSIDLAEVVSTLGLKWIPQSDQFCFKVSVSSPPRVISKRHIASEAAKLFDPLGWLAPVLIRAKILLHYLWCCKLDWDSPVTGQLLNDWTTFRSQLADLENIRIQRCFGIKQEAGWQLHAFADASKRAYAATVFIVQIGRPPRLIAAKSKVAPTKTVSLPRLELCGTVLVVRLLKSVLEQLPSQPGALHCWSDSKVVLAWLDGHPSRWNTFVANRVSEVLTTFPNATWRHVPSADNPADCATRGFTPEQLRGSTLWWNGPSWLSSSSSSWPELAKKELDEQEKLIIHAHVAQPTEEHSLLSRMVKFSSLIKMLRILAYALSGIQTPRYPIRLGMADC